MFVYVILNPRNGKRYIGVTTVSVAGRWAQHVAAAKGGKTTPLHRAIRKYGAETFVVEELAALEAGAAAADLFALERKLIAAEGTQVPGGYNVAPGGEGITSVGYPDSVRKKIGDLQRGKPKPEKVGVPLSEAHKAALSAAWDNDRKAALAERNKRIAKPHTAKANEQRRAVWTPEKREEHRQRNIQRIAAKKAAGELRGPWAGKTQPPEMVAKRVATLKARRELLALQRPEQVN